MMIFFATLHSQNPGQFMCGDVHEMCEPGVLRPQSSQTVRQAKAPGWISWGPFLSSISFGQAKEMDSGLG